MATYQVGDSFHDVVGPLGHCSEFVHIPIDELKKRRFVFIGGGVGIAPIFPQVKWLHNHGITADCIIGAKTRSLLVYEQELSQMSNLFVATDDGTSQYKGLVTTVLQQQIGNSVHYDEVIAIGPMVMMRAVANMAKQTASNAL